MTRLLVSIALVVLALGAIAFGVFDRIPAPGSADFTTAVKADPGVGAVANMSDQDQPKFRLIDDFEDDQSQAALVDRWQQYLDNGAGGNSTINVEIIDEAPGATSRAMSVSGTLGPAFGFPFLASDTSSLGAAFRSISATITVCA